VHLVAERAEAAHRRPHQDQAVRDAPVRDAAALVVSELGALRRRLAALLLAPPLQAPTRQRDREEPDRHVGGGRDEQGGGDPERPQEDEAGGERARDGTERVEAVEQREVLSELARPARNEPRENRQRSTHERGGHDHGGDAEGDPQEREPEPVVLGEARQRNVEGRVDSHEPDEHEREEADPDFQEAVEAERPLRTIRPVPEQHGPEGQPAHVDGEDRRDGEVRTAEDERERANPGHLVDEARCAGQEEERVQEDDHRATVLTGRPGECQTGAG